MAALRQSDGTLVRVRFGTTTLRKYFAELQPQPDEELGVRYLGERTSKSSGSTYKDFRVAVLRDGQAVVAGQNGDAEATEQSDDDHAPF